MAPIYFYKEGYLKMCYRNYPVFWYSKIWKNNSENWSYIEKFNLSLTIDCAHTAIHFGRTLAEMIFNSFIADYD